MAGTLRIHGLPRWNFKQHITKPEKWTDTSRKQRTMLAMARVLTPPIAGDTCSIKYFSLGQYGRQW